MRGLSLLPLILAATVGTGSPSREAAAATAWEKVFDGGRDKWVDAVAATGGDVIFVGGDWGIATLTKAGTTVESTHGHGVLGFFIEASSSVFALGEGELISHFDGKEWREEHVGRLPPRNQRRAFSEHMLYRIHDNAGPNRRLVAFGLVLVLVKQSNGTWATPPQSERASLLEAASIGPKLPEGPSSCGGRAWHWLGQDRAFFSCDDRRAFIVDEGRVTSKGKLPRQCGSTVGALAYAAGEVYATCGTTLWKTDRGAWRRIEAPNTDSRELSSVAFADHCVFVAGDHTVWRTCETDTPTAPPGLDAGQPKPNWVKSPDAGTVERAALPVVEEDDCSAICDKLLGCKQGPWQTVRDCVDACKPSNEDATSARTYRCVAKAKSCARMKKCTR